MKKYEALESVMCDVIIIHQNPSIFQGFPFPIFPSSLLFRLIIIRSHMTLFSASINIISGTIDSTVVALPRHTNQPQPSSRCSKQPEPSCSCSEQPKPSRGSCTIHHNSSPASSHKHGRYTNIKQTQKQNQWYGWLKNK